MQPADGDDLRAHGAWAVGVSRCMSERLQVQPNALDRLDDAGVDTHVLPTDSAVDRYNELQAADEAVAGLFHSTC